MTTILTVPNGGTTLCGIPGSASDDGSSSAKAVPQAFRLDLEDGVLQNILRSARSGGKGVHVSFGKTITLNFGNRSKQLTATTQPTPTELYNYNPEDPSELKFVASQSHRLAMKQAQDNTLGTDAALAKLQMSLATHEAEKQARQLKCAEGANSAAMGPKPKAAQLSKTSAMHKQSQSQNKASQVSRPGLGNSSPGLATSPHIAAAPTSVPSPMNTKMAQTRAIRNALIHLLAIRPVSEEYLTKTVRCTKEECKEGLQRVGRPYRLDPTKWDLTDKAFRELDPFMFYKDADDRRLAIDRAVTAFDRMRIPERDVLWDKLLPIHERGQHKVLSKLQMREHPGATTPKINVQRTEDSAKGGLATNNDSDRLAPSDAEPKARSSAPNKKSKASDTKAKAASSKLATKPSKVQKVQQPNDNRSPKPTENAKKGAKKGSAAKFEPKSSEFVRDSDEDEDEEMRDMPAVAAKSKIDKAAPTVAKKSAAITADKAKASAKSSPNPHNNASRKLVTQGQSAGKRPPGTTASSSESTCKQPEKNQTIGAVSKNGSRQRTGSSPLKPSPLGSSPPANASDLDQGDRPSSNSSTSTPLMGNARKAITKPAMKGSKPPQNTSDGSLKRKANDIDSGIHEHDVPPSKRVAKGTVQAAQPTQAAPISPPTSDSNNSSHSEEAKLQLALHDAENFKKCYADYYALYQEVAPLPKDVPNPSFERLMKMHEKLAKWKEEIAMAADPGPESRETQEDDK